MHLKHNSVTQSLGGVHTPPLDPSFYSSSMVMRPYPRGSATMRFVSILVSCYQTFDKHTHIYVGSYV